MTYATCVPYYTLVDEQRELFQLLWRRDSLLNGPDGDLYMAIKKYGDAMKRDAEASAAGKDALLADRLAERRERYSVRGMLLYGDSADYSAALNKRDLFSRLPFDVLCLVVESLPYPSALQLAATSRALRQTMLHHRRLLSSSQSRIDFVLDIQHTYLRYRSRRYACYACLRLLPDDCFALPVPCWAGGYPVRHYMGYIAPDRAIVINPAGQSWCVSCQVAIPASISGIVDLPLRARMFLLVGHMHQECRACGEAKMTHFKHWCMDCMTCYACRRDVDSKYAGFCTACSSWRNTAIFQKPGLVATMRAVAAGRTPVYPWHNMHEIGERKITYTMLQLFELYREACARAVL